MAEMDTLGIADNTLVIIMGDNGHFTKYSPQSGYTPMIYRGGKGYTTEGGVRCDGLASSRRSSRLLVSASVVLHGSRLTSWDT